MIKTFKFVYESEEADGYDLYPNSTKLKATHTFDDDARWVPILYQFCKFLEGTGYGGVVERVVIKDPFGLESEHLFETTDKRPASYEIDWGDDEEDEDAEEEDKDFQDVKKEIA
jgi:hypothetical protein